MEQIGGYQPTCKPFREVEPFLRNNEGIAPTTRVKLLFFFTDVQKKALLQMEAAVVVNVGSSFVQASDNLEGDGPLELTCYEMVNALTTFVNQVQHYPNAQAVSRSLSFSTLAQQTVPAVHS